MSLPLEFPTPDPRTFDDDARSFAEALAPQYSIRRKVGEGGMGIVYLARDRRLDRLVAIKTLPRHLAADAAVRERFLRESRTAAGLSHPNIVPIHGANETDGHVFFVMGYVDGDSLAAHVGAHRQLDPRVVVRYMRDVAAALSHAHRRGIIHRDIKAENILIERSTDRAMVTDFGIARFAEAAPLTATGQLLGTVHYVSPEQVCGDAVDARSDLYSLGVVGFLALTGEFPLDATLASAVLVAHVTKAPPPVASVRSGLPASLATIVDRCLAKNPAHRYADAEEVIAALDQVVLPKAAPAPLRSPRPALISDTEAHAVWQRAAELQASTGIVPRPEAVPRLRDAARDVTRSQGFAVDRVREAAGEAGIGERYVEHALVEHGLGQAALEIPSVTPTPTGWLRFPLRVAANQTVEGEIDPRHFERLVNVMREETNRVGEIRASTRELMWSSSRGTQLRDGIVSVIPGGGRTLIRASGNIAVPALMLSVAALALGAAVGAGVAIGSHELMHLEMAGPIRRLARGWHLTHDGMAGWTAAFGFLASTVTVPIASAFTRWAHRRESRRLGTLVSHVSHAVLERTDANAP